MIPLVDLKAQYQTIRTEIDVAINRVLESCQFVLGEEVENFEREFADYCQATQAVGVNSGTSALHLALLAAGIGPGDEVITVPFTFVATVAAICYTGATPVFVDVDPESFTMDARMLERALTKNTKAIIPVHLYGQPCDMDPILEIARRRRITVIEDAAQAHGARYKGRPVGTLGDMACFSFYPGKNLGAYGEGGMVVTNNSDFASKIRMLRDWGQDVKYHHVLKGYNYRLEALQAAVLRVKLAHLQDWTSARQTHASHYHRLLEDAGIAIPRAMPSRDHVYHVYAIRVPRRESVQKALERQGIQTGIHYPIPVHLQEAHRDLGYTSGDFPHSERAANEVLSLPMFPELSAVQVQAVSQAVRQAIDEPQV